MPLRFFKLLKRCTAYVESAFRIDVNDSSKSVCRKLVRRAQEISSSPIYNNVDLAKFFDGFVDCILNRIVIAVVVDSLKLSDVSIDFCFEADIFRSNFRSTELFEKLFAINIRKGAAAA